MQGFSGPAHAEAEPADKALTLTPTLTLTLHAEAEPADKALTLTLTLHAEAEPADKARR